MSINISTCAKIKGEYRLQVLQDGKVVEDRGWQKNMVLNQGLNVICTNTTLYFSDYFKYHCLGTGSAAVAATDTGLGNETASTRTNTYLTGTGNCGTSLVGSDIKFRRTFDHAIETTPKNYTEHGLSWAAAAGNNLFTRALISGGTLTVSEGQQVRCIYDITVTVSPSTSTALTVGGAGWPVSPATDCTGNYIIGDWRSIVGNINTSGNEDIFVCLFAATTANKVAFALTAITLPSFGSAPGVYTVIGSSMPYAAGSYVADSFVFTQSPTSYVTASAWSSTNINGWLLTFGLCYKYNQAQTKANTHRLRYPSYTVTWARA